VLGQPLTVEWLQRAARSVGIDHVACAAAEAVPEHERFAAWLAADLAGDMTYLARDSEARRDPRHLLESARSVVAVALSYLHPEPGPVEGGDGLRGQIARYARAEDYHLVLKRRLGALAERIQAGLGREVAYRVCVDSAPLLERALGARAGLGFVGKNSLLITPGVGSYTLLGELLLDVEIVPGQPIGSRCGACRLCIDACPTGAIIDEYKIDARRCISYLTIENTGPIPVQFRQAMGTWIFGCDLCQEVCPWNGNPGSKPGDPELRPRPGQSRPELLWLLGLGEAQFRRFVKRTAMRRIGRRQLMRNVAVALGNVGTAAEVPAMTAAMQRQPPLVRQHLAWALGEIGRRDEAARPAIGQVLRGALAEEEDAAVQAELAAALEGAG